MTYRIILSASAKRTLTQGLPEAVAVAVWEFLHGPVAANPQRVGKPLRGSQEGRHGARRGQYRIIYVIDNSTVVVHVIKIDHRRDVYHS